MRLGIAVTLGIAAPLIPKISQIKKQNQLDYWNISYIYGIIILLDTGSRHFIFHLLPYISSDY